jgi:hypothetical protein
MPGVWSATVFGQSMHLLVEDGVSEAALVNRLAEVGIHRPDIRPIAPSLEDVFVTLTRERMNDVKAEMKKG